MGSRPETGASGTSRLRPLVEAVLVAAVPALVLCAPRLLCDLYVAGADARHFYFWAQQFGDSLDAGLWYPRWAWASRGGLGAPVFLYYPPLYYYLVWLVQRLVSDLWWAMVVVDCLAVSAVALVAHALVGRLGVSGLTRAAIAVAVAASPFGYMSLLYVQGLPWNLGYAAVLAAIGIASLRPDPPIRTVLWMAAAVALIALTHVLSAVMVLICVAGAALAEGLLSPRARSRRGLARLIALGVGCGLGLAMASVYLWPAVTTLELTNQTAYATDVAWQQGFAFPIWTAYTFGARWQFFQWWLALLILGLVVAATAMLVVERRTEDRLWRATARLVGIAWIAMVLSSELAYPIWAGSAALRTLQYPYRLFSVGSLAATLAAGLALALPATHRSTGRRRALQGLVVAALAAALAATLTIEVKFVAVDGRPSRQAFDRDAAIHGHKVFDPATIGPGWRSYLLRGGFGAACRDAGASCRQLVSEPQRRRWSVDSATAWRATLPMMAFPGWRLSVDGASVPWQVDPDTGLISTSLPAGESVVDLEWIGLDEQRTGRWLSIAGLTVWLGLGAAARRRRRVEGGARNADHGGSIAV